MDASVVSKERALQWNRLTFDSYEEASLRHQPAHELSSKYPDHVECEFDPYSFENMKHIWVSTSKLLAVLIAPYAVLPLWALVAFDKAPMPLTGVVMMGVHYMVACQSRYYKRLARKAGLYCARNKENEQLLKNCKFLTSQSAIAGCVPGISSTPWMLSGDFQTLFPFLVFRPSPISYIRRWVRVPLDSENARLREIDGEHEAVAVDWAPGKKNALNGPPIALIMLSGLTGGSREGYMLDLVNTATSMGWDCFVVIGRGLAETPCHSGAVFHAARTSDFVAVAKAVRALVSRETTVCCVGLSMGGIVLCNALCRGRLDNVIDGGVSISACLDPIYNSKYEHSVDLWQPFLVLGMKKNLLSTIKPFHHVISHLGEQAISILNNCATVVDMDTHFFPAMNSFLGRDNFYANCVPTMEHFENLTVPILAVHASDDPIVHPDTQPRAGDGEDDDIRFTRNGSNSRFISLITETGGHVGWPVGLFPWKQRWLYQNNLAIEFCSAIAAGKKNTASGSNAILSLESKPAPKLD